MRIPDLLKKSEELIRWLDQRIDGIEISSSDRSRLVGGCFDVALEHQKAVVLLVAHSLYGSAFSLVRLIFEAHVRGIWLLRCASDDDLERFKKGKLDKAFGSLVVEIEKLDGYNVGVLSKVKSNSWSDMNSYTHSGFLQIVRRNTANSIEPNYSEDEIIEALNFANAVGLMSAIEVALLASRNELANAFLEKAKEFAEAKP